MSYPNNSKVCFLKYTKRVYILLHVVTKYRFENCTCIYYCTILSNSTLSYFSTLSYLQQKTLKDIRKF